MKFASAVLVGMVVLGTAMAAVAGSDNAKNLVGVWEQTKGIGNAKQTFEFTKDGKLKITAKTGDKTVILDGTYKLKDDTLTTVVKQGDKDYESTAKIVKLDEKVLHIQEFKGDKKREVDEFKRVTAK